ncbi:MAG TPA: AEC family transporter [Candidatus Blautia merdigallinarum]|uniref:AEC family transporter n=1 Tax=Candidatus Blautia merdigallinarum TaxID=2838495 RepID=A0A9D2N7N0_9FIRM|nr:AEC family transporter [Candidatus Blautia merdigallinarum]
MSGLVVLEQMAMIFILILTGFVLYKKKMISDSASKDLSALVVNVCSPGLIIVSMFNDLSQIPRENVVFVGVIAVIFYIFLILFGYFLVWVLKVPDSLRNAYVLMTVFGNTGFIGIPVALAIIGPESMVYVIVFNFLFNLTIFTFGIMLLKKDTEGKKRTWKDYLSPGLIVCIAAFLIYWFQLGLPEEIETLAGYYGNACTLLSMIVIGISLAGMKVRDMMQNKRLLAFVIIRFIAFPVILALALRPVLPDLLIRATVVLMAALPVGNFPAMLCEQYGRDPKPIAEGIVVTTILSVFTITLTFMFV